jgi:hypothetical protein
MRLPANVPLSVATWLPDTKIAAEKRPEMWPSSVNVPCTWTLTVAGGLPGPDPAADQKVPSKPSDDQQRQEVVCAA